MIAAQIGLAMATPYPRDMDPDSQRDPACPSGICSSSAPPLIGSTLTGTGLTLDRAAQLVAAGEEVPLSDVQRRIVEERVLTLEDGG